MNRCPFADRCGACRLMDMPYEEQLLLKHKQVQDLYPGIPVEKTIGMPDPLHYRHKAYATFGSDRRGNLNAGLYMEGSHQLVFPENCLIQHETVNSIIRDFTRIARQMKLDAYDEDRRIGILRHLYIRLSHHTGRVLLTIVIGSRDLPGSRKLISQLTGLHPEISTIILNWNSEHTSMILGRNEKVIYGSGYIEDEISGIKFRISSRSFYQVNPEQTERLYKRAIEIAGLKKSDSILDACCGIGTITLLAARQVQEAIGVEIVPEAVRDARENSRRNGIRNASFYCDDANTFLTRLDGSPDVVFLDPPRSGMNQTFMESLARMKAAKIVYISCNPATQARDLQYLTHSGYRIEDLTPVDMFPYTDNTENIALAVRHGS